MSFSSRNFAHIYDGLVPESSSHQAVFSVIRTIDLSGPLTHLNKDL